MLDLDSWKIRFDPIHFFRRRKKKKNYIFDRTFNILYNLVSKAMFVKYDIFFIHFCIVQSTLYYTIINMLYF